MIWALMVFFGFVVLGALMRCIEWTQPSRGRLAPRWKVVSTRWDRVDLPAGSGVQVPFAPFGADGQARPFADLFAPPHEQFAKTWKAKHGEDAEPPQLLFGPIGAPPRPSLDDEGNLIPPAPDDRVALVRWPDGRRELVQWIEPPGTGWATVVAGAAIGMFALVALCAYKDAKKRAA